jgi:hypothetical protein
VDISKIYYLLNYLLSRTIGDGAYVRQAILKAAIVLAGNPQQEKHYFLISTTLAGLTSSIISRLG